MNNFGEKLIADIQRKILIDIQKEKIVQFDYGSRLTIPQDIIKKAFANIDQDKIIAKVKENIEDEIAKTIVHKLLTEVGTDTKQLMSNNDTRQQLKYLVYPKIMQVLNGECD
jgi:hypothetical protein